jgi:predicted aconitase
MHLTREDERIFEGEYGDTLQRSMEILVALGDIYGADELIPITSAQIAGVSYKTIGEAGLEWVADLNGKVAVPSILNPAGMDLHRWSEMGIDDDFASMQQSVIDAYERLGIKTDCTCTPYHVHPNMVHAGDHLAWSESSAVSFANSVIGAKTNREGGPSALAAAFLGKTPRYGYHLDENRIPTHRVHVEMDLKGSDYGALGFLIGEIVEDGIPLISMKGRPTVEEKKALGAAMAASGSVALYYIEGLVPKSEPDLVDKISIDAEEIKSVYERYSPDEDVDIVALGCPHCSRKELLQVADLLSQKKVKRELWICTARRIKESCPDIVAKIEKSGARVVCDTCMVVSPASENYNRMMVNSGKALAYIPGLCGIKVAFGSTESCIETATK